MEFDVGEDSKAVTLSINNDDIEETLEQLYIEIEFVEDTLNAAADAGQILLVPVHKASVIIKDDDRPSK